MKTQACLCYLYDNRLKQCYGVGTPFSHFLLKIIKWVSPKTFLTLDYQHHAYLCSFSPENYKIAT